MSNTEILMASTTDERSIKLRNGLDKAWYANLNQVIDDSIEDGTLYNVERRIETDDVLSSAGITNTILTYIALKEKGLSPEYPNIGKVGNLDNLDYVVSLFK